MGIMILPIITSDPANTPDIEDMAKKFQEAQDKGEKVDEVDMTFTSAGTMEKYTKRMKGVFQHIYDFGYI